MNELEQFKIKKHEDNPNLSGEYKWGDAGQIILFLLFLAVWISDSFIFHYSDFTSVGVPVWIRLPIGLAVTLLSGFMARKTLKIIFGTKRDKPEVIKQSYYKITRHPMYLSVLLLYTGLFIITLSLASLIFIVPIFLFYNFIAAYEEKILLNQFGEEYQNYINEVGRWYPKTNLPKL